MKTSYLKRAALLALSLFGSLTAQAHISYTGRDFGTFDPAGTTTNTISGQTVSTKFGWADGADADWGDSHRGRCYRLRLNAAGYVTITFTGVTGGTGTGLLMPGFSVYSGLAHVSPAAADHDYAVISSAWLASRFGYQEGCFNSLGDWKIGNDDGTTFADLSSFTFLGYAVDGTAANFGSTPGIVGDGSADNTVTGTFYLEAGDYTVWVGGAEYAAQPTPSSVYLDPNAPSYTTRRSYTDTYRVNGTVTYSATNPASTVAFSSATVNAALDATTAYVTLTRPVGGPAFTVALTNTDDSAIAGTHYTAPTGVVNFAANETSRTVAIALTPQTGIRPTRSFSLGLGAITGGATAGAQTSTTVTIQGNDSGGVLSLAATTVTATQGDTSVNITVNRTSSLVASTVALTTTNGTAVAGTDFTAPTATVDFAENETTKTVSITLIPRAGVQPARSFTVGLGATTGNATVGSPSSLTVTINPASGGSVATITNADPGGDGIGYAWTVEAGPNQNGTFQDHVGAWSWEDNALFAPGEPAVGWTHTSRWLALTLTKPTVLTVTMARDEAVPYASGPGGVADATSMFPSFTLWKNWDNDGDDDHTYNNKGNVSWAEDLQYLDHVDNSTETSVTRSWALPAGNYTFVLGSNAPATNTNRQGFSFNFSTTQTAAVDTVPNVVGPPAAGGIGYAYTVMASAGDSGSFKSHVGAWSWEDNALFDPGEPAVGWTHTSRWVNVRLHEEVLFTVAMARDATVPWSSPSNPDSNQLADTSSMFPSFTLYRGADQDGGDDHTYNNKGRVAWAEDISYLDHLDNSTDTAVSRTWRLPAGQYTLAVGSNAPATNPLRQGFSFNWSAQAIAPVTPTDPSAGGIGYAYTIVAGAGDSGSFKTHVGAWSWEDNALFSPGEPAVGWTHTSKWVALQIKDPVTFSVTMARDATVPWVSASNPDPNQLADTSSMFPSLTLWRGWDNDGSDDHTYTNKGNVAWAEDITYLDHLDNSTQNSITRSWTLAPGSYTFALGSNAPATNVLRQGFSFSYSTSAPVFTAPVIVKGPAGLELLVGKKAEFKVQATGPSLLYQWLKNGAQIEAATTDTLTINAVAVTDAGSYTVEVRNAAGVATSPGAALIVIAKPVMNAVDLDNVMIGQLYNDSVSATNNPSGFVMTGKLPTGLTFNAKTGAITGRALASGSFPVSFKAMNKAGVSDLASGDTIIVSALANGTAGSFGGVIGRSAGINDYLGGSIRINPTAVGTFSGSLVLGTKSYPLTGLLDTSAAAPTGSQTITRPGQSTLTLSFAINGASRQITGTLAGGVERLAFTARQVALVATSFVGNYTLALKLDAADQSNTAVPHGHGFGAFSVAANGATTGVLTLADETKLTFTGPIEQSGNISLYRPLYGNLGSLLAVLNIDTTANNALDSSEVNWFKHSEPAASRSRVYKAGFAPLDLVVLGRKYVIPASATTLPMGLTAGNNNAKLTFADGGAPSPATRLNTELVTITAGSPKDASIGTPNPGNVKLKLTPGSGGRFTPGTTGSFTGSFKLTDSDTTVTPARPLERSVTFNGVIVDDGTSQKGYGTFLLAEMPSAGPPATMITTSNRLSGSVLLEAATSAP